MAFKSNINGQLRGFYYAASGDNALSGQTVETPKLTIQAAIDEATNLSPPPSGANIALVTGSQGGSFTQGFVLTDFVQFNGEDTTISASQPLAVAMATGLRCRLENVSNFETDSTVVMFNGVNNCQLDSARVGVSGANTVGINLTGAVDNIFIDVDSLFIDGSTSTGIEVTSTQTTPIDINIDTVSLAANDEIFIDYNAGNATSECVLRVSAISSGTFTGTTGFLVQNGILAVESSGDLRADTAIIVKSGGILRISAVHLFGNITVETGGLLQIDAILIDGDITVEAGALMTATIGTHTGDLTNAGTANIISLVHTGSIANTGIINGIVKGVPGGNWIPKEELILSAFSIATQSPSGTDAPLQVEFGAAQGSGTDPVEIDVNGEVTFNRADQYHVDLVLQYGRTSSGGASHLYFRFLVDGTQVGNSIFAKLDGSNDDVPVQLSRFVDVTAAQTLTVEFLRDSAGNNSGDLNSGNPTLGDWSNAPSAALKIFRSVQID